MRGGKRIPQGETLQEEKNTHPYIRILDMYQGRILNLNEHMLYAREKYWDKIKSYIVDEGDVILAIVGNTLGMVSIIGKTLEKANLTENCCRFSDVDTEKVLPLFLYYSLKAPLNQKQIEVFRVGSSQPKLPIYNINQLLIPKYSLNMQKKIIDTLSAIDSKIENNNKINGELESMAKIIYDYWFLQFDFPDENEKPYRSSGGKMVWNEELNKEIPKGWCVGSLNRYIAKDKGGDWGKEVEEGNYIKKVICLRGADFPSITGNSKLDAPVRYILEKSKSKVLENGDLIIEISGGSPTQSTGRICYINNNLLERFDTDIVTSNFCKAISLNNPKYMYWFYAQWLKIYDNNVLFRYEGKTTGIKNLLFDLFINDYNIAVPPNELIIQYNNIVCTMYEEIQKKQKESQELASLRDFLLPLLMNGQVGFK